jgi:hypothetical protein
MAPPRKRRRTSIASPQDISAETSSQATENVTSRPISQRHSIYSRPDSVVNNQPSEHALIANNGNGTSNSVNVLPPEFVLEYERLIKQQSNVAANNSNITDTVTTAHSASTSSQNVSQSTNLMETQTQFNNPAAFPEVQTTDTNLNTNIHQLVDKILIQDKNVNESPATCSSGSALSD